VGIDAIRAFTPAPRLQGADTHPTAAAMILSNLLHNLRHG